MTALPPAVRALAVAPSPFDGVVAALCLIEPEVLTMMRRALPADALEQVMRRCVLQELVALGAYLDQAERGARRLEPQVYQECARAAAVILRAVGADPGVLAIARDQAALGAILEGTELESLVGPGGSLLAPGLRWPWANTGVEPQGS